MNATKLHFARFEFKYLLSKSLRKDLESELNYFLEFDPFVQACSTHQYFVRSLYYDDPDFTCFYDKIDGLHLRSKFRIRTYTNCLEQVAPQFLELKGRYNNLVFKHRTMLDENIKIKGEKKDLLTSTVLKSTSACEVKDKFQYNLYRKRIMPIALVDYVRRPYISKFNPDFRLTFDSEIKGTKTASLFPDGLAPQSRSLLPGYTVMEVKFRRHIPSWFHRLIQVYELQRVSISKICHAMIALEMADDL